MQVTTSMQHNETQSFTKNTKALKLVDLSQKADGLYSLHLDQPSEKVNKLNPAFMEELSHLLDELKLNKNIKTLVVLSEKEGIFIAGADIAVIQNLKDPREGEKMAKEGQAILQKLEQMPFPVIVAVNGACMGGGTEFALCCKYILVSDNPATRIALPEVNLGVMPGFGGTIRLPQRIGLQQALDYVLTGKTMNGEKAFKLGFADALLPYQDFNLRAMDWAASFVKGKWNKRPQARPLPATLMSCALEKNLLGRMVLFSQAKKQVLLKTRGRYPAPLKIIDVMQSNYGQPLEKALKKECKAFGELAITNVSKSLIQLFYATESIKKQTGVPGLKLDSKDKVQSVGLLGAGVMGGGIAQLLAHKDIPVRMKDIDEKALGLGLSSATKIFSDLVSKKKISSREAALKFALISPTTEYSGLSRVDLVIEAVIESMDIKKKVLKEAERNLNKEAFFATNTSSLSVTELATASQNPQNVVGLHFFNPVHKMPLVEVIRGQNTSDKAVAVVFDLAKRLSKIPIVVKDGPGFLVNRLLMPYLNEASYLIAEGAPVELLDEVVLNFGMPMGPATLLDEVGLDVAAKVSKILYHAFGSRATPCVTNERLVNAKLLGKKTGKGFYLYDARGKRTTLNPDLYSILGVKPHTPSTKEKDSWIPRVIYPMINEAALCLNDGIVASAQDVDLGMIMGTGFPPFHGGLLRYADSIGLDNIVSKLEEFSKLDMGPRFAPSEPLLKKARNGEKFYS